MQLIYINVLTILSQWNLVEITAVQFAVQLPTSGNKKVNFQVKISSKIILIIYVETHLNGKMNIYLVKRDIQNNTYNK